MAVVAAAASTVSPRTVFHHLTKKRKKRGKIHEFKIGGIRSSRLVWSAKTGGYVCTRCCYCILFTVGCRIKLPALLQCCNAVCCCCCKWHDTFCFSMSKGSFEFFFFPPKMRGFFFSCAIAYASPTCRWHPLKMFLFWYAAHSGRVFFCIFIGRSTRVFLYHTHTRCWKQMIVFYSSWTLLWVYKQTHTHVWSREREESRRQKMRLIPSSFTVLLLEDGGTWNLDYEE